MFFYKSEEIDKNQRINLNIDNEFIYEILDRLTKNNNLAYRITGKHIIITKARTSNQQGILVTGVVTDTHGEPIIGANIMEREVLLMVRSQISMVNSRYPCLPIRY